MTIEEVAKLNDSGEGVFIAIHECGKCKNAFFAPKGEIPKYCPYCPTDFVKATDVVSGKTYVYLPDTGEWEEPPISNVL